MDSSFPKTDCSPASILETKTYDKATWNYQEGGNETGKVVPVALTTTESGPKSGQAQGSTPSASGGSDAKSSPKGTAIRQQAQPEPRAPVALHPSPPNVAYDLSLQHPRCVYQLLKQQYSRYTPEMVERITGIPQAQFLKAADMFTSIRKDGDMKKVATVIYAVGWTQHTFGTQIIRTAAMLQLLMGNVGRAGGGVNALRGHSNIQGATDMAGIFDILPGYLEDAGSSRQGPENLSGTRDAQAIQTWRVGVVQLLVEHAEVHGFVPEGAVRTCGDQGKRFRVQLPAQDRSQVFLGGKLERHVRGQREGVFCLRHEWRDDRSRFQEEYRRLEEG